MGQHILFHLRLQIPLCMSLSPLAGSRSHLEKHEVYIELLLLPALVLCQGDPRFQDKVSVRAMLLLTDSYCRAIWVWCPGTWKMYLCLL